MITIDLAGIARETFLGMYVGLVASIILIGVLTIWNIVSHKQRKL